MEARPSGGNRRRSVTFLKVRFRFQPWQLAVLVVLLCASALTFVWWRRNAKPYDAARMVAALPTDQATVLYMNVATLRSGGILEMLAGSKAAEEPDYRKFVDQTGFDYRTDLDALAVSFLRGDVYATVRGHFEWKRLADYARSQGGSCQHTVCEMPGSSADRKISFYPLTSTVLALAVATPDGAGVHMIGPPTAKMTQAVPPEPVWIKVPPFAFSDAKGFPTGSRSFLTPLAQAQKIVFALGPQDNRFQIRLDVTTPSPAAAATLAQQLTEVTVLLKKMINLQHMTPNPSDLSGVLVSGTFEQKDARVTGVWPIERGFVQALASGQIQ